MWREHYPPGFELYHVTQYLNQMVSEGRLSLKRMDMTVTYHDPCDLGRGSQEYQAPRSVIRAIPGLNLVEMAHNRENCLCCGGGGNLEMIDSKLSGQIAEKKIQEVLDTGADAVVTACQQCVRIMNTFVRRNKMDVVVLDVVQLIHKAMEP
jgi:heterodisulfide reductase subunit D